MPEPFPNRPSKSDTLSLILKDHSPVMRQFREEFGSAIDGVSASLVKAFHGYRDIDDRIRGDLRAATVTAFFFTALNSLVQSTQLLLVGMLVPSGNLMRQYGEASAMAVLCSASGLDIFERFSENRTTFPVHDSLGILKRKTTRRVIPLDPDAWDRFAELTKFYDKFSHPTSLAVASQFMFGATGMLSLGGEFDPAKVDQYRIEIERRRSASEVLGELAGYLVGVGPKVA